MSLTSSKVSEGSSLFYSVCVSLRSKANAFRSVGNHDFAEYLEHIIIDIEAGREMMNGGYDELLSDGVKSSREMVGLALGAALKVCNKERGTS